jgi:TonB-dependent starch-binding outer membrane protein SusC
MNNQVRIFFCFFLFLISFLCFSQKVLISGYVSSETGNYLAGVSIVEKETSQQASTDLNGKFSFSTEHDATLIFSMNGFFSQLVKVGSQTDVFIILSHNREVELGYDKLQSSEISGSIDILSSGSFNKGLISTPNQLFEGKMAGVMAMSSSGELGAASNIAIRGTGGLLVNNEPLYVVDGMPLDNSIGTSSSFGGIEGSSTSKSPLIFLNPNDIDTITILKDASSTAIYGIRGANGVILIKTKNSGARLGSFSFSSSTSVSNSPKRFDLLASSDFLQGVKSTLIADGITLFDASQIVSVPPIYNGGNTNWQDQIYRDVVSNGYNLSWRMERNELKIRISGGYENQKGIILNSGLQRTTGMAKFYDAFFKKRLNLELSALVTNTKNSYAPITNDAGFQGSLINATIYYNPTAPVHNSNGYFFDKNDGSRNPAAMLSYFSDGDNIDRQLYSGSLSFEIVKGLTVKSNFGFTNSSSLRKSFSDPRIPLTWTLGNTSLYGVNYNNPITGNGRAAYQYVQIFSLLTEGFLTYQKILDKSKIGILLGFSYLDFSTDTRGDVAWGLKVPVVLPNDSFVKNIDNFVKVAPAYLPNNSGYNIHSFFSRFNYSILKKYFFTGIIRADASSKFISEKWAIFPSLSFKWDMLKEHFVEASLGSFFSDFNFRVNYGKTGSQEGLNSQAALTINKTFTPYGSSIPQTILFQQGNDRLKWEESTSYGIGLDWTISKRRLSGTIEYFNSKRKDILANIPVAGGFGSSTYFYSNLPGYISNQGFELSLNYNAFNRRNFIWTINFNSLFLQNEVKEFDRTLSTGTVNGGGLTGAFGQVIANNQPLFTWNLPSFMGFDANGYSQYYSSNSEFNGSALPTFNAGITNNIRLGNWALSFLLTSSTGFYVYNNTANAHFTNSILRSGRNTIYNAVNTNENPRNPAYASTRFLEKGDFIRLSNAQLGYSFKLKAKCIKSLSVTLIGQNIFLITQYSGLDPDVNVDHNVNGIRSLGFDYAGYPTARTLTLGLQMDF